jgi:hypothetical protein
MKVLTTEVTPISGGRPAFAFDAGVFAAVAGFSIAAPGGEAAGAAVVRGSQVQIRYVTTSPFTDEYPILTIVLPIRDDAVAGSQTLFTLDPHSLYFLSTTGPTSVKVNQPATVTVGGPTAVSISDVVPGEGIWPAGTLVSVRGNGFSDKTSLRVSDAGVRTFQVVSPTELQFALTQDTDVRGLKITVQGQVNSSTYFSYMRGITSRVSARPLLSTTEPIFTVLSRATNTFGSLAGDTGADYDAIALQNPNAAAVAVSMTLNAADGTLLHATSTTLASRARAALELSEWLDGVSAPAGSSVVVTASAPIDAIGLRVHEGVGEVDAYLPREVRP